MKYALYFTFRCENYRVFQWWRRNKVYRNFLPGIPFVVYVQVFRFLFHFEVWERTAPPHPSEEWIPTVGIKFGKFNAIKF